MPEDIQSRVLLISKPLTAPWNDSGKNWARDVARYASIDGVAHHVLVPRGSQRAWIQNPGVIPEEVYAGQGSFAPRKLDNARVMGRLMRRDSCDVVHFCFAPNRRTNLLARFAMRRRRQPSVHSVLSVPAKFQGMDKVLFADKVVCVSHATARKLRDVGVRGVEVVPASIPVEEPLADVSPERIKAFAGKTGLHSGRPLVVFPGDYEFSRAADVFAEAIEKLWRKTEFDFVFACRIKRAPSLERETHFKRLLAEPHRAGRVHFLREVDDIRALLSLASLVVLPSESTYAKMDIPLVVLEALAERTPVILADVEPLRETLGEHPEEGGGLLVPPLRGDLLAERMGSLLRDERGLADLGRAGRDHVLEHHDSARTCRRYTEIYRDLMMR